MSSSTSEGAIMNFVTRELAALFVVAVAVVCASGPVFAKKPEAPPSSCRLDSAQGAIQHVVYVQFDNVHLRRDNPNVPSDLEQMPNLYKFLRDNGTLLNKHYTVLISHTAGGITSSLTGLYPDRMGITVSNSYDYYNPVTGKATNTSGFKYWTAPVAGGIDNLPNMVNGDSGMPKNTPAPWVTYTSAGCDVGNVSAANTVLENNNAVITPATALTVLAAAGAASITVANATGYAAGQTIQVGAEFATVQSVAAPVINLATPLGQAHPVGSQVIRVDPTGDMTTIFGKGSAEWNEGKASQLAASGTAARALAQTDFVGIAIHCSKDSSSICNSQYGLANAKTDSLPDEPGGYSGFRALFGAKYVNPAINGGAMSVNDINGTPITDPFNQPGFPGFDSMPAATTLGYIAQMLEADIPIVYAYVSDVHDNHAGFGAYGPGEDGYVTALKSYDDAFGKFFARLAADGIDMSNTLFVFTADENDHFAGQMAQNCDGVTTRCKYNTLPGIAPPGGKPQHGIFDVTNNGAIPFAAPAWPPTVSGTPASNGPFVGEMGYNIKWAGLMGSTINGAGYDISFDSAPSFYIDNQPQAVDASGNVVLNPTLRAFEKAAVNLMAFDPYLDPTKLIPVARYLVDGPTLKALHMINADRLRTMPFTMFAQPDFFFQAFSPCPGASQGCLSDNFAWIHGDYANDIGQTWLGMVGPGVQRGGIDDTTWTDHTDIVPTVNWLIGLTPDYQPDGRVIMQILIPSVAKGGNGASFQQLGDVYKQLNAPYGDFAHSLIVASTNGIKADDATYLSMERQIQGLTSQRDGLIQQMKDVLDGSANGHREQLIQQGLSLLGAARALAGI
ncbi:MAG TPA: hypothetical protein VKG21_05770 [Casimicrobiaceae bacterium]|nr:hypothetical protein [Casimicrobiaceae bacterium]